MQNFTAVEIDDSVGLAGVDVERPGLPGLIEHLDYSWQIHARKIAGERGHGIGHHLRRLKSLLAAHQECANVSGNFLWGTAAVHVIIATRAKSFHQGLVSSIAYGNYGNRG